MDLILESLNPQEEPIFDETFTILNNNFYNK